MRLAPTTRRVLAVLAVAVVAAPWAVVARTLVNARPVTTNAAPARSIAWGGRVFSTQADLAAWLRSRGGSYDAWAAGHPGDRAILEHTTGTAGGSPQAAGTGSSVISASSGGTATPQASAGTSATPAGSSVSWLTVGLLLIASMTMLAALVPAVVPVLGEDVRLTETHRAYLFAAGLSVSVGVLVAGVLS